MDTVLFGSYTVRQVLYVVAALFAVWLLIELVGKLRKKPDPHKQAARCPKCGWQGTVSRYAGRCPKCNETLGDLLAKKS